MIFYRDLYGGELSNLRSPGGVGRPVGAVTVRACAGGHELQVYDKFPTPGTNTPSIFRDEDVRNIRYVRISSIFCFSERSRACASRAEELGFAS